MSDNLFFDCHFHVFTIDQIPMLQQLRGNAAKLADLLDSLGVDDAACFIRDGNQRSGEEVFTDLMGCYLRAHQGSGVAAALMQACLDHARDAGGKLEIDEKVGAPREEFR